MQSLEVPTVPEKRLTKGIRTHVRQAVAPLKRRHVLKWTFARKLKPVPVRKLRAIVKKPIAKTVADVVTAAKAEPVIAKIANAMIAAKRTPPVVVQTNANAATAARAEPVTAKNANVVIAAANKMNECFFHTEPLLDKSIVWPASFVILGGSLCALVPPCETIE